ncbi:MAG: diguanylate cyclase [Thermoanaerobaculia bacterium]
MRLDSWEETLRGLRREYLLGAGERLDRLGRALANLGRRPGDVEVLGEVRKELHGFAGSGGTYGFPGVSAAGREGEAVCLQVLSDRRPVSGDGLAALRRWSEAIRDALRPEMEGAAQAALPPGRPAARAGTAIILDPNASFRGALAELLGHEGLNVRVYATVDATQVALAGEVPDLLVTSLSVPGGSGAALIEHLRERPGGESTVVVAVSAGGEFLDKVEAVTCGADFLVEKPLDLEALVRKVCGVLERPDTDPPRILSVEDDPDQAAFINAVLASAGYEVRLLADPARLESEAISFGPDLILMDVNLPGVRGYDLVRFLRHDERFATLPVVFLTAEGRETDRIAALRAGGDDHLVKPVPPGLLISTVSARLERARFLKSLLVRDGLTGLLTHTAFLERARTAVAAAGRAPGRPVALALLDLDGFKIVNDSFGHPVGDRVLTALGALLRRRIRASDTLGRLGGDEFAFLLEGLSRADALRLVQRLLTEFASMSHRSADGQVFHVTFSGGIAFLERPMYLEGWRRAADEALYAAKAAGRNRVELAPQASDRQKNG